VTMTIRRQGWTANDDCGHLVQIDQLVTYYDRTPPVLEGYTSDQTVECPDSFPKPAVTATDNCDYALSLDYLETPDTQFCSHIVWLYRRWSATDICGSTNFVEQTVTVVDTTPPTLNIYPKHMKVECDKLETAWKGPIIASDDCDYDLSVKFTEEKVDGTCPDEYTLVRRWTATDCTGNEVLHTQSIFVSDTIPPYFTENAPADRTETQDSFYSGEVELSDPYSIKAEDNCAFPSVLFEEITLPISYECDYMYYRIRTWSIHDDCGNTDSMVQTIDMVDTSAPDIEQPDHVTVECDQVPPPCDVEVVGDDDYAATITFKEVKEPGTCNGYYLLIRTWRAADCANNEAIAVQTITVRDTVKPVFTRYPEDTTIDCDCDELTSVADVDAVDNCDLGGDEVQYTQVKQLPVECEHTYDLKRTWIAHDECGNGATHIQWVRVEDMTPPLFCDEFCDPDWEDDYGTISCNEEAAVVDPLVKDDCDDDPLLVAEAPEVLDSPACINDKKVVYKWWATDKCENSDSCSRTIEIVDDEPPFCTNCDMFCWPTNSYMSDANYAVYATPTDMIEASDICGAVTSVVLLACNSTEHEVPVGEKFDTTECVLGPQGHLYVHLEATDFWGTDTVAPDGLSHGRYYYVWFELKDACGLISIVKKTIWIPSHPYIYEDAVGRGDCVYGIGTENFEQNLPVIF